MSREFEAGIFTSDLKRSQQEYKIHVQAVKNIRASFPGLRFFHIPNRPGDATDGFFKKEMGARAGASDLLFSWNDETWQTGYQLKGGKLEVGVIEIKAKGGKLENDQNRFLSSFSLIGWRTAVAYSCKQVHEKLISFGLIPKHNIFTEPDYSTDSQKLRRGEAFFAPLEARADMPQDVSQEAASEVALEKQP